MSLKGSDCMADPASVRLLSLATAAPTHVLPQETATQAARQMFAARYEDFEAMVSVFENTGIRTRRTSRPLDWYFEAKGWPERTAGVWVATLTPATRIVSPSSRSASSVDRTTPSPASRPA